MAEKSLKEIKLENYNRGYKEKVLNLIKDIPTSNGSRYYKKIDKNIAIVTDDHMFNFYKGAVNLLYINYSNYKEVFENNRIDALLFVTCWKGMKIKDWRGITTNPNRKSQFYEIIEFCKSNKIVTIFQSIEDPSNYDKYIDIASKCDYIFTTDENKINDYKKDCNNENVYVAKFGVNPTLHNPIGIKTNNKFDKILFAGSWTTKYKERCIDMEMIFDGVLESDYKLDIIDRNFNLDMEMNCYPKKYIPYTSPEISHEDLQKVHKLYNWIINLNSIKYSPTMCAMRAYEAQALGNLILSNYSMAVNKNNPNIFIINDKKEVKNILEGLNEEEIYKHQVYGIRNVMSKETVFERLDYILSLVDKSYIKNTEKKVLVVTKELTDKIKEMFYSQTYSSKKLIEEKDMSNLYEEYDFIAFFNKDYTYEEYYLEDMINGFKYTNSDYITKDSYYENGKIIKGIEHNYVNMMRDKYKTVFDTKAFSIDEILSLSKDMELKNGYSIDHFELNTCEIEKIENNKSYDISVVVPVYNNGKHLYNKCFMSLKRSSVFDKMEIILVDHASTDIETSVILKRLSKNYKNIKICRYEMEEDKSSNKELKICSGKYITFLDSYNESVNDGYSKLYDLINKEKYKVIIGNGIKLGENQHICESNPQAMMIKKEFLMKNINNINLTNLNKELIHLKKSLFFINSIKYIDETIYIEYL